MIAVAEAKKIIKDAAVARTSKWLPIGDVHGLTLAVDVVAGTDIPNFEQSSMDGYAIKFDDRGKPLHIIGEMAAGASIRLTINTGEAARIFTGAPLPEGADTVVMQEKTALNEGRLIITDDALSRGLNVRAKGAEVTAGEIAIKEGTCLSAAAVGFLAGIGCNGVTVYVPPRVGVILTGNELQQPGKPLAFGQVYEANSVQLQAALGKTGIRDVNVYTAEDDTTLLTEVLNNALMQNDVVLLNGGVSVGDYDFVTAAAAACGVSHHFHKIKQKPGKPLFFGTKDGKLVFGLPGNPSSSLTCFYEYVLPALENIMGLAPSVTISTAVLTHDYAKPSGLTHFLKGVYKNGSVTPLHAQESFRLHSFAQANCFIVLPEASEGAKAGENVEVHLLPL